MPDFTDQLGRLITLKDSPKRIISLVPSQTELLFDLGLEDEVIAITKFCVHPASWFRNKIRIGGTKNIDIEKIKSLQSDLIIANKEENTKEQIEALQQIAPVWISDVNNLEDALAMMHAIGEITGKNEEAGTLIHRIKTGFDQLQPGNRQLLTAYFIWRDPYMSVGTDTFIHDMLLRCGFRNVFEQKKRYPEITISELSESGCELILLSSEPYPFKEKHKKEIQLLLPNAKILLVDGEMFSWYGSRLIKAPGYFRKLLTQLTS